MNELQNLKEIFARLADPFHPDDIEWRAGATKGDKTKALALAYITSRAVMDRLDEVIGPENWKDEYAPGPDGGVICGISLRIHGEWLTKWDGADNTDFEAIKGGLSDAFKRAGYKWGIGRYLYRLETTWVPCEVHGKSISLKSKPALPAWALPDEWRPTSGVVLAKKNSPAATTHQDREKQLLTELGYDEPVKEFATPEVMKKESSSNGGNGAALPDQDSTSSPKNGKRSLSWNGDLVAVLLKSHLVINPTEAVSMLNESDLSPNATPDQVLKHFQQVVNS